MLHDLVARAWIQTLKLRPHPDGGWYVETARGVEGPSGEMRHGSPEDRCAEGARSRGRPPEGRHSERGHSERSPSERSPSERSPSERRHSERRRARGSAVYYLLAEGAVGLMHRIRSDEVWHHYAGDSAEVLQLREDGSVLRTLLGPDVAHGERPQVVVARGTWFGVRIVPRGRRSLLGCTASPGAEFASFDLASRADLVIRWPDLEDEIRRLTHPTAVSRKT